MHQGVFPEAGITANVFRARHTRKLKTPTVDSRPKAHFDGLKDEFMA
jgi:hypothetical protein